MEITLHSITSARDRIHSAVYHTPCPYALALSRLCGAEIYCKLEHLQATGSFKERGAANKLLQLPEDQKKRGVIAASAGNHAQALAYHGGRLNIPVTVVMPVWAPLVKVSNCRALGARVILCGEDFDQAVVKAEEIAQEQHLSLIKGFDDPEIISGQGTLGLEILDDIPDVDAIIVPVGGGGLIAGIAVAVKAIKPTVQIIGVEPLNAPTLHESLAQGKPTRVAVLPTLADGLAVGRCGDLCFELIRSRLDDLVLVNEAEIARAILRLLELEKMVIEGAGAVSLAAAMLHGTRWKGKKIVLCLTGGNIDVTTISRIIDRGLAADGRLCRITAYVSDRPGSLARLTSILAETGASVKEVGHDRHFAPADIALVGITVVLETRDFEHIEEIKRTLKAAEIQFVVK
ncbi:MAG TPA: threonine ammonia-lyase [Tepidisphaeraceae bacterium]|jgi:threonine dehydratase